MPDGLNDTEKDDAIVAVNEASEDVKKDREKEKDVDKHRVRVGLPGGTVHQLELSKDAQLSAVVSRVREIEELHPTHKRIRLIVAGKLFSDHSQYVRDVVSDGGFIHCAVSDVSGTTTNNNNSTGDTDTTTTTTTGEQEQSSSVTSATMHGEVHIPISMDGDVNSTATADNQDANVNLVDGGVRIVIPNLNSQTAFDRLLRAGFTPDEIRLIRRHVRALRREARGARTSATLTAATTAVTTIPPDPQEHARHADGTGNGDAIQQESSPSNINNNNESNNDTTGGGAGTGQVHVETTFAGSAGEGTNGDFLMGCIFGYLLGIIILVLLLDNHATRRWRVGIIAGVATNCAFGVLRSNLYLHASSLPAP